MSRAVGSGKGASLLVMGDQVCAWRSGTDGFDLSLNYWPGFATQRMAVAMGYQTLAQHLGILPRSALSHLLRALDKSLHSRCR